MKQFNTYIQEKLIINKDSKLASNGISFDELFKEIHDKDYMFDFTKDNIDDIEQKITKKLGKQAKNLSYIPIDKIENEDIKTRAIEVGKTIVNWHDSYKNHSSETKIYCTDDIEVVFISSQGYDILWFVDCYNGIVEIYFIK